MKQLIAITAILAVAALSPSCSRNAADSNAPHATVFLRDGTSFAGAVKATSPAEITLIGDDNNSRTFDMKNVRSIEYGETAAAPPPSGQPLPPRDHPEEATIKTRTNVLPVGTQVAVRTDETIDSGKAVEGQTFAAEIARDVRDANGDVVIPRGSNAQLLIRSASRGGRFTGAADLVLDLHSISVGGRQYRVDTADLAQKGRDGLGKNKRTGEFVGGGSALGAIVGAIAGGGRGAAIGAASGAGAGAATQVLTRGRAIRVPAESLLTFKLDEPLRVYPVR